MDDSRASTPASADRPATVVDNTDFTLPKRPWRPYVTPFDDIVNHHYKGTGTEEDPYVVDWLRDDVENPLNWSPVYKWTQIFLVSFMTLAVALSSSAYAGGIKSLMAEFGGSSTLWTGGVSLFVVGFAFGPLMWAPASEVFGRRPVYILSTFGLTLWQAVAIASPNPAAMLVFRGLAGFFGSSPLTNAGGSVSDILSATERGIGMALFCAAPFLGPALGPICGGFINDAGGKNGWKWVMAFLAIFCGCFLVIMTLVAPETHMPTLLRQRANTLSKATGKTYRYIGDATKPLEPVKMFRNALVLPWKFLLDPLILILSVYIAIIYGTLYLNFAAYPIVFQQGRGWSTGIQGLAFLGISTGVLIAVAMIVIKVLKGMKKAKAGIKDENAREPTPEDKLPGAVIGGIAVVIGLAGFAATCGPDIHWIASIMFGIPFGFGMVLTFLTVMGYLVDAYPIYAASVLASNSILRSLFGAAFPLFAAKMYEALGVHWAAAVPGFLALACVPFTLLFVKYGAQVRAKSKWARESDRQMAEIAKARAEALEHSAQASLKEKEAV